MCDFNLRFTLNGNDVEFSSRTGNNTKFMFVLNGRRVFLHDKPSLDNDACRFIVRHYYKGLRMQTFLKRVIARFEEAYNPGSEVAKLNRVLLELESMEIVLALPDYHFKYGWDEFTWNGHYEVSKINFVHPHYMDGVSVFYDDVEAEAEVDVEPSVKVVTARGTVINFCKRVFEKYSKRVGNYNFKPVKWSYYYDYFVGIVFKNWDGSPMSCLY